MNSDDIARLAYLVLLGTVVAGWFFVSNRENLGKTAQQAAVWGLIFVGFVAGYGLWNDIRDDVMPRQSVQNDGSIVIPRGVDGHYGVTLMVNGVALPFIVDTGASQVVLSQRDAQRIGIDPAGLTYFGQAQTANGVVRTAPVTLETVELEGIRDTRVRAVVNEGDLQGSLLGMTYLNRFDRIEIANDKMVLHR